VHLPPRKFLTKKCIFRYILLNPFLRLFTKSPNAALQCTLHALFLPTPFKYLAATSDDPERRPSDDPERRPSEEVLKPGALYAECAVVPVRMPASASPVEDKKTKGGKETKVPDNDLARSDDGELGGVKLGMQVWDDFERELTAWEAAQPTDAGRRGESNAETAAPTASGS
jgi:hypothetical protein